MNNPDLDLSQWRRLSPWSILYFIGRILRGALDPNIIIFLAPVYGLYQIIDNSLYFAIVIGISAPALVIGSAFIQYAFFFFRVDDNNFHIKRGVFFKRQVDLPFYRIQDVHIDKPFYFKPLNLVSASLDTAGSSENEAVLAAVSDSFANELREWIFSNDSGGNENAAGEISPDDTDDNGFEIKGSEDHSTGHRELILTRTPYDIFIHGITNNKVWLILAALFPLVDRVLQSQWDRLMAKQATEISALLESGAHIAYGLIALLLIVLIVLMMVLSVVGSFLLLYGYELTKTRDTLSRESGLLSRNQINLKIRRVQFVQIKQSLFDRIFARFNLTYRQLDPGQNAERQSNSTFLVPSVTAENVEKLTGIAFPDRAVSINQLDEKFHRISPRFILQEFLLKTLPAVTAISTLVYFNLETSHIVTLTSALLVAGLVINFIRWYRWGYFSDQEYLFIRKGFIGKLYVIIPCFKLQQASLVQSYPMTRNRHAHFSFAIGLSGFRVPYIKVAQAVAMINNALYNIESSRKSWM